jgi:hypothetical protein
VDLLKSRGLVQGQPTGVVSGDLQQHAPRTASRGMVKQMVKQSTPDPETAHLGHGSDAVEVGGVVDNAHDSVGVAGGGQHDVLRRIVEGALEQ